MAQKAGVNPSLVPTTAAMHDGTISDRPCPTLGGPSTPKATTSAALRIDLVLPLQGSVLNRKGRKVSVYEIRVKGHLDGRWSEWFDGLTIANMQGGDAVLSGEIVDQSALHGVLAKVRDLGLPLLAVSRVKSVPEDP